MNKNILKPFLILSFFFIPKLVHAQVTPGVRDFETTRLMSTAGTGVASVLLTEAAVLNPATIGIYKKSALYYQSVNADLEDTHSTRLSSGPDFGKGSSQAVVISDTSSRLKGSAGYFQQEENNFERKRFTFTGSSSLGAKSSFGITARRTEDTKNISTTKELESYTQVVMGVIHILSDKLTIGTVVVDPFKSQQEQGKVILGLQYTIAEQLIFMTDFGANFNENFSDTAIYRGALQTKFFSDFYFRFGVFQDETTGLKGNGWGISWIGGKLNIDLAYKTSKAIDEFSTVLYQEESISESSLSATIFF